jgi:hypothetical protein
MKGFIKEAAKISWSLVLILGVTAGGLRLLGVVPGLVQPTAAGLVEFVSVEKAQSSLGFEIVIPAYFPSYLAWPSERITGQHTPSAMSQMYFVSASLHKEALIIEQEVSVGGNGQPEIPWVATVLQQMPVDINGAAGTLVVGKRADGVVVNAVYWQINGYRFIMVSLYPVNDLLTMSRSMHP